MYCPSFSFFLRFGRITVSSCIVPLTFFSLLSLSQRLGSSVRLWCMSVPRFKDRIYLASSVIALLTSQATPPLVLAPSLPSLSPRTQHHHLRVLRGVLRDGGLPGVLADHSGRQLPRGHHLDRDWRRGPQGRRATIHRPDPHVEGLGVGLGGEEGGGVRGE